MFTLCHAEAAFVLIAGVTLARRGVVCIGRDRLGVRRYDRR